MRHELVHWLAHAGPRHLPASLPGGDLLGRAGAFASVAGYTAALVALAAVPPVALITAIAAFLVDPVVGGFAVIGSLALTTALGRRLGVDGRVRTR